MKWLLVFLSVSLLVMNCKYKVDFGSGVGTDNWRIVDDRVMGGRSLGRVEANEENIVFSGDISLENNGGFSWAQYETNELDISSAKEVKIRVKTDEHSYHFTAKSCDDRRFHYESEPISTAGEWETIIIAFSEMQKTWRGRQFDEYLDGQEKVYQIGFILKDKKAGSFSMAIDKVQID